MKEYSGLNCLLSSVALAELPSHVLILPFSQCAAPVPSKTPSVGPWRCFSRESSCFDDCKVDVLMECVCVQKKAKRHGSWCGETRCDNIRNNSCQVHLHLRRSINGNGTRFLPSYRMRMMECIVLPNDFKDRVIFMSLYNDIDRNQKTMKRFVNVIPQVFPNTPKIFPEDIGHRLGMDVLRQEVSCLARWLNKALSQVMIPSPSSMSAVRTRRSIFPRDRTS